jgi:hypothetical protein
MSFFQSFKLGGLLLLLSIGLISNSFADGDDKKSSCKVSKIPGVYMGQISQAPIFDAEGNIIRFVNSGRILVLHSDGIATMISSAFSTTDNKFPDPVLEVLDLQQPPTVGTWTCVGEDKIRLLIWEYYFYSNTPGTPDFNDLILRGTIRNTWLLQAVDNQYSAWTALDSTLVQIDPPNDPLDPNAPTVVGVHRSNLPTFKRVPNFGDDLNLPE